VNVNKGAAQWRPNLIGYDALNSFVSPSWHAQALFNEHRGDELLAAEMKGEDPSLPVPYSVTRDKAKGLIYVKLVNSSAQERPIRIDLGKDINVEKKAELVTLTSKDASQTNSLEHPDAVVPLKKQITDASSDFSVTIEPNSLTILTLKLK
jgi:alpha-N-arabinofuranosidase